MTKEKQVYDLCDNRCPSNSGILAGICKGKYWLMPEEYPKFAVSYSYCLGGCGVFGDASDVVSTKRFLEKVFVDLKSEGIKVFEFSSEDEWLTQQILDMFPEKSIGNELEYSYRNKLQEYDITEYTFDRNNEEEPELLKGYSQYRMIKVDENMLEHITEYDNAPMLTDRIENSWNNIQDFLAHSISYIAIFDKRIVGVIFGSGRYEEYLAIDIEVEEQHRRRGLAEELTLKFLQVCNEKNIIAQWDCVESNEASAKLAEKVGLQLFKKRPYYWFEI